MQPQPPASAITPPPPAAETPSKRPRVAARTDGLRGFAENVVAVVRSRGRTSYQDVADELVEKYRATELAAGELEGNQTGTDSDSASISSEKAETPDGSRYIRRRVYDVLNVLTSIDLLQRSDKKEITWQGIQPQAALESEMNTLTTEIAEVEKSIEMKKQLLRSKMLEVVAMQKLMQRNTRPPYQTDKHRLPLPLLVLNSDAGINEIDLGYSKDRKEALLRFPRPFTGHVDTEILEQLGLAAIENPLDIATLPGRWTAHLSEAETQNF
eukprot:tig00000241_g20887.t1